MLGGIYAAAMAWAIIPHYGESNKSGHSRFVVKAFMSSWKVWISHFYSAGWIMLKHFVQLINILKIWCYCVGINKTFLCTRQRFAPNYPLITRKSALWWTQKVTRHVLAELQVAAFWRLPPVSALTGWSFQMGSAYQFHSWRVFVLVCAFPSVAAICALTTMPESPRFFLEVRQKGQLPRMFSR